MKTFLLAAVTAAGFLLSTSSADAQFRNRRGTTYSYSYPSYSYSYPTYSSDVVVTSGYTPTYSYPYSSGSVITSGGTYYTSPSYSYPSYSNYPSYYNSGYYNNSYSYPSYYNNGYYNSYSPGLNINSSGAYWNGRRIWR